MEAHLWSVQVAVIRSNLCIVDPPPADIILSRFYLLLCSPQLFLHSVFGYRGIVLFPWHARLYDRDITPPISDRWDSYLRLQTAPGKCPPLPWLERHSCFVCCCCSKREPPGAHGSKEVKGKTHTYYQVLIDTRDCPHIVSSSVIAARLPDNASTKSWCLILFGFIHCRFWIILTCSEFLTLFASCTLVYLQLLEMAIDLFTWLVAFALFCHLFVI